MRNFTYLRLDTVDEVIDRLAEYGEDAKVLAGGQSLVLLLREGLLQPDVIIDLTGVAGLNRIQQPDGESSLSIGALVTHRQMEQSSLVGERFPVFRKAYATLASPPVRNLATLGGNLAHNAPGSDPPPLLVVLDAWVTLKGPQGERTMSVLDFGTDFYETAMGEDEILLDVSIPYLPQHSAVAYQKFAIRPMDMAIVGVAARISLVDDQQTCSQASIALSGVAATTIRIHQAEESLVGELFHPDLINEAAQQAVQDIDPISDVHASAEYRRHLTPIAVRRVLTEAWRRALGD